MRLPTAASPQTDRTCLHRAARRIRSFRTCPVTVPRLPACLPNTQGRRNYDQIAHLDPPSNLVDHVSSSLTSKQPRPPPTHPTDLIFSATQLPVRSKTDDHFFDSPLLSNSFCHCRTNDTPSKIYRYLSSPPASSNRNPEPRMKTFAASASSELNSPPPPSLSSPPPSWLLHQGAAGVATVQISALFLSASRPSHSTRFIDVCPRLYNRQTRCSFRVVMNPAMSDTLVAKTGKLRHYGHGRLPVTVPLIPPHRWVSHHYVATLPKLTLPQSIAVFPEGEGNVPFRFHNHTSTDLRPTPCYHYTHSSNILFRPYVRADCCSTRSSSQTSQLAWDLDCYILDIPTYVRCLPCLPAYTSYPLPQPRGHDRREHDSRHLVSRSPGKHHNVASRTPLIHSPFEAPLSCYHRIFIHEAPPFLSSRKSSLCCIHPQHHSQDLLNMGFRARGR